MSSRAILFPGQGAQFVGMSADLVASCPETKAMFDAASELMGQDLLEITTNGPEETIHTTAVSQPAIFVVSLAVIRAIEARGGGDALRAVGTAGLSLGEYSALVFCGAMTFEDALEIVVHRGRYMQEACDVAPSGMTSILGLNWDTVKEVVADASDAGVVAVSNVNADLQIVVSGELDAVAKAAELAQERGAKRVVPLKVAGAYHSPMMASATGKLEPYLAQVTINEPKIPFYPNVSAEPVSDPEQIRDGLRKQIESSVLWAPTLKALVAAGMESALEPGPGRVVAGLVRSVERRLPVHSVLTSETIDEYIESCRAE